jgi:chromosome segregation ATPase
MSTGFGKPGRSVIRDKVKDDELLSEMAALRQENEKLTQDIERLHDELKAMECADIDTLRTQLDEAREERDMHYIRCASLLFSDVLRDTPAGDIRKWAAEYVDAKAEAREYQQACDRMAMQHKVERDRLRMALQNAADDLENWGAYASDYFKKKWNLQRDIDAARAALKGDV